MIIRQLNASDSKEFYQVRLLGLELHPEAFGTGADDFRKATDEQVKDQLGKSGQNDFSIGAFIEEKLVGVISLKREPKSSVKHKATVWGFFVVPQHRHKKIGTKILEKLILMAHEIEGLDYLRAIVTISDSNIKRIFESVGFSEYGIETKGIKQDKKYFDQSFVKLNLKN